MILDIVVFIVALAFPVVGVLTIIGAFWPVEDEIIERRLRDIERRGK